MVTLFLEEGTHKGQRIISSSGVNLRVRSLLSKCGWRCLFWDLDSLVLFFEPQFRLLNHNCFPQIRSPRPRERSKRKATKMHSGRRSSKTDYTIHFFPQRLRFTIGCSGSSSKLQYIRSRFSCWTGNQNEDRLFGQLNLTNN